MAEPAAQDNHDKGTTTATNGATAEADKLYASAVEAAKAGDWQRARDALFKSYQLNPTAKTAANLGRAEIAVGRYRDAAEHLSFFLRQSDSASASARQAAEGMLAEAKAKIGTMTLHAVPANAEIFLDGQRIGIAPVTEPLFVDPGKRVLWARHEGIETERVVVDAQAGGEYPIRLERKTPTEPPKPSAAAEDHRKATAPFESKTTILVTSFATGAVVIGGATVFVFLSNGKATEADHLGDGILSCPQSPGAGSSCAKLRDLREDQNVFGNVALWGYVAGGATLVGTSLYALLGPKSSSPKTIGMVPVITEQQKGLLFSGTW